MHICHMITRGDVVGGAQVHVRDLILEQLNQGNTASIICGYNSNMFSDLRDKNVKIYCLDNIKRNINIYNDTLAIIKIIQLLKKIAPDIIACHTSKAGIIGRLAGKIVRIKTVYTPHGWIFSEPNHRRKSKVFFMIEKLMAMFCDKIITVSNFDYLLAKKLKLSAYKKLIRIHNGIPDISSSLIKSSYDNGKIIKLITVARLEEPKDYNTLFTALSQLGQSNWQLDIFGDGSMREALEQDSLRLGMSQKINFHGDCFDIENRLFNSDVFLLISKSEGFPISIIEAMRAGLPVIASNVGGVAEAVNDQTGVLVEKEDPNDLQKAIETLMFEREVFEQLGKNAREDYINKFSSEKMADKTLDMYRGLLEAIN